WADAALRNCQADAAGAAGDHPHGDATGVGVAVASGSAASGGKEGDGSAPVALSASPPASPLPGAGLRSGVAGAASSTAFLFFFGSFFFPTKKVFRMLLMSRPTTCSIKFVLGRSTVPPT